MLVAKITAPSLSPSDAVCLGIPAMMVTASIALMAIFIGERLFTVRRRAIGETAGAEQ